MTAPTPAVASKCGNCRHWKSEHTGGRTGWCLAYYATPKECECMRFEPIPPCEFCGEYCHGEQQGMWRDCAMTK